MLVLKTWWCHLNYWDIPDPICSIARAGVHLRAVGTSIMPDRAASAAAMALWGSALASTAVAAGMKKDLTSGSMLSSRLMTCLAEAAMTASGPGGPTICRLGTYVQPDESVCAVMQRGKLRQSILISVCDSCMRCRPVWQDIAQ